MKSLIYSLQQIHLYFKYILRNTLQVFVDQNLLLNSQYYQILRFFEFVLLSGFTILTGLSPKPEFQVLVNLKRSITKTVSNEPNEIGVFHRPVSMPTSIRFHGVKAQQTVQPQNLRF